MFEYTYGKWLSSEKRSYYIDRLIKTFAQKYDIKANRLWNCLKKKSVCIEFEEARKLDLPETVIFYLERQNEVFNTTFQDICKYVDELEPWEYIDAYVFDDTFTWLLAITHEELKCLVVGLR